MITALRLFDSTPLHYTYRTLLHFPSHPTCLRTRDLLWPIWLVPGWIALWIAVSLPADGQTLPLASSVAQPADTSREQVPLGMGVFGAVLGIHSSDSLIVMGDLMLDHANVVGEGVLVLKGRQPRRLMSTNSILTNLAIDNPTQVTLEGDLRVTKHLTVKGGTFAADNGTLTVTPVCQTQLLAGGRLKTGSAVHSVLPVARLAINYPLSALLGLTPALPVPVVRVIRRVGATDPDDDHYVSLTYRRHVPPPEML